LRFLQNLSGRHAVFSLQARWYYLMITDMLLRVRQCLDGTHGSGMSLKTIIPPHHLPGSLETVAVPRWPTQPRDVWRDDGTASLFTRLP
jgi:hypothetical protein